MPGLSGAAMGTLAAMAGAGQGLGNAATESNDLLRSYIQQIALRKQIQDATQARQAQAIAWPGLLAGLKQQSPMPGQPSVPAQQPQPAATPQSPISQIMPYARGNAVAGGPSPLAQINPQLASRIAAAVQAMPPQLRQQFQITSGFRTPAREQEVYATQRPGQPVPQESKHSEGLAVDIGDNPAIENWISQNPQYGLGFPLANKPGERNHMEMLPNAGTGLSLVGRYTAQQMVRAAPPELLDQSKQTAEQAQKSLDPSMIGQTRLEAAAQAIEQANPNAPPAVKVMALTEISKILAPQDRMELSMLLANQRQGFQAEIAQMRISDADWRAQLAQNKPTEGQIFQQKDGTFVRVTPQGVFPISGLDPGATKPGQKQQLPELTYPEKWDGMPEKPPPGVREDIWDNALVFARTHQMPAMGFAPGVRDQIVQAYPAALHALGIKPSDAPDIAAMYAGERHGEIVSAGRAANISLGINEAQKAAPQVIETSRAVPRFDFPAVNQFTNWLQEKTGSPEIIAFKDALNTYLNVYASVVSRSGRLTDSQQKHAYELLSTAYNQGQIERGIEQLNYEMELMKEAVPETMHEMGEIGRPPATQAPATPARPPTALAPSNTPTATGPDGKVIHWDGKAWVDEGGKPVQ